MIARAAERRLASASADVSAPSTPYQRVLGRLDIFKESDGHAVAYCPTCPPGKRPGLSVTESEKDGRVLIHCFRGCATDDIVAELELSMAELHVDGRATSAEVEAARERIEAWLQAVQAQPWRGRAGDSALRLYHALAAVAWRAGTSGVNADYRRLAELAGVSVSSISRAVAREQAAGRIADGCEIAGREPDGAALVVRVRVGGHYVSGRQPDTGRSVSTRMATAWQIISRRGTYTRSPAAVSDTAASCSVVRINPPGSQDAVSDPGFAAWRSGRVIVGSEDRGRAMAGSGWRLWTALQMAAGTATAAELATAAGLTTPTAHRWLARLAQNGLVIRTAAEASGGRGRPATRWLLVPDAERRLRWLSDQLGWTLQAERQRDQHDDDRTRQAASRPCCGRPAAGQSAQPNQAPERQQAQPAPAEASAEAAAVDVPVRQAAEADDDARAGRDDLQPAPSSAGLPDAAMAEAMADPVIAHAVRALGGVVVAIHQSAADGVSAGRDDLPDDADGVDARTRAARDESRRGPGVDVGAVRAALAAARYDGAAAVASGD